MTRDMLQHVFPVPVSEVFPANFPSTVKVTSLPDPVALIPLPPPPSPISDSRLEKDESSDSRSELNEQIDLLALLLAGVAKNTDNIIAKHMATSSLAAHASGGEFPLESTAVMDAPLVSRVSTTSIIPKGAAKCKGLQIKIILINNSYKFVKIGYFLYQADRK